MSVSPSSNFSVLLPAATVAVYSAHEDTRAAVSALATDWRFARIRFDVRPGDVGHALAQYAQTPSPNLLIVDTDVIDQGFAARLEQLASTCSEGTNAVVIGPVNDVAMYRYLINMGVSDYLVRPLQTPTIAEVIARILMEQLGTSESHLISIIGAKGGAGASTVAGLLAYGLAEVGRNKTILMDVAGARSYLSVSFGTEPLGTMTDAARAAASSDPNVLSRLLYKSGEMLQVLATGNDRYLEDVVAIDALERMIDRLLAVTPYVVTDLSGASPGVQRMILSRSQRIMLVSQPTLSSLRLARTLLNEIKELKGGAFDSLDLVLNMSGIAPGAEVAKSDIEAAMEHKVSLGIPFDPKLVIGSEAQAKILGTSKGAEKTVSDLLARVNVSPKLSDPSKGGNLFDNLFKRGGR